MTKKHVPQLNAQGFYLGPTTADECQIVAGDWLIPGGAVDAPLPRALGALECARYAHQGNPADPWDYLPDYSASTVYSLATGARIDMPPGWTLEEAGGTLDKPDTETAEDIKAELLRAVAAKRWAIESGGLMVGGAVVATAIEDQNRITSVIVNAERAGLQSVDFKATSGWVTLTLAELVAIASLVAQHVQRCYSAERAHAEAIAPLHDIAALRAYDLSAGWPSSPSEPAAA